MKTAGRYKVVRLIGLGATSFVYLAVDPNPPPRPVAVKVLPPSGRSRADREWEIGSRVDHPNVNRVLERTEVYDQPALVMEYAPGLHLARWMQEKPGTDAFMSVFRHLLAGIGYLHGQGVVHRDVKPENVMVAPDGNARIIDFDLATTAKESHGLNRMAAGTVAFISPEQVRGEPLDPRSDLYAAGVIMYWGLTGEVPFSGDSVEEVLRAHLRDRPRPPGSIRAEEVGAGHDEIALRLLEKSPADRYQSAEEVLEALG